MPPRKGGHGRNLTTAERMIAAVGPSPAALVRAGLSHRRALALEREWAAWERAYGFAYRVAAGIPTPADRERLDAGEKPDHPEPPEPPGFDLVA